MEFCINVKFDEGKKSYYFRTNDPSIKENDYVIVETILGLELGKVFGDKKPIEEIKDFELEIKPIIRKATKIDIFTKRENEKLAKEASKIFETSVLRFNLDMKLINTQYTFDRAKILFTYVANDRVDFRELLKYLATKFHCRIELKQLAARERAQKVGGIGTCGLPLCCTTFFNSFESISVNKAKNQMLTINISKISGQCGKLMCCLKYEDDIYTDEKKKYPLIGTNLKYNQKDYRVSGINILSKIIKLENDDGIEYISLDDFRKINKKR